MLKEKVFSFLFVAKKKRNKEKVFSFLFVAKKKRNKEKVFSFLFVAKKKRNKEKAFGCGNSLRLRLRSNSPQPVWKITPYPFPRGKLNFLM